LVSGRARRERAPPDLPLHDDHPVADRTYTAPVDLARRLRFDVEESGGRNTGAVEIEVYDTLQE